ncbi:MAG: amidohydrolase [Firmicutes bacterium]|nr:amidohydrolase [Bacillota bacterium]
MLDILITNGYVLTMEGPGVGMLPDGAVAIRDNKIVAVGPSRELEQNFQARRRIDAKNKVVMPGLVDAHIHTGIGILRGLAQDTDNWMQQGLWPFTKTLTDEARVAGSLMNIIEGVKAGTTTFCDYDVPMLQIAANHARVGTRARVAETINEMPEDLSGLLVGDLYPLDPAIGNHKLTRAKSVFERWHGYDDNRITCLWGPQGPDMLSRELLQEVKALAEKHETMIHMHVAQGDREINQMLKRYGMRSIQFLDELGYLDWRLLAVHLTEATKEETQLVARRGAAMLLCSGSIGIIDGIVPPAAEFLEARGNLALGSDQAPGNNCNNMFNEMKFTAILNKCRFRDPRRFPAWQMLRLATIDGARAIGLGEEVGSLRPGKKADMIMIDLDNPALAPIITDPVRNIVPNLVYSANGSEVDTVIIDGKIVMEARKILTLDEKLAIAEAHRQAQLVARKAKPDAANVGMTMMRAGQL